MVYVVAADSCMYFLRSLMGTVVNGVNADLRTQKERELSLCQSVLWVLRNTLPINRQNYDAHAVDIFTPESVL